MQKIPVLVCLAISRPVLLLCSIRALVNPSSCPKMSCLTHEINMVQTIEMKMGLKTIGSQQPSKSTQLRLESGLSSIVCSSKSSDTVLVVTTGTFLGALSHGLSLWPKLLKSSILLSHGILWHKNLLMERSHICEKVPKSLLNPTY
jgi:hypothetical protein